MRKPTSQQMWVLKKLDDGWLLLYTDASASLERFASDGRCLEFQSITPSRIKRLVNAGWVTHTDSNSQLGDKYTMYYKISETGKAVVSEDLHSVDNTNASSDLPAHVENRNGTDARVEDWRQCLMQDICFTS